MAQFVRLTILNTTLEKKYVTINEINVYTATDVEAPVTDGGKWGITVNFPLVPVTAFLNPITQSLTTMASYQEDHFGENKAPWTYTAIWNATNGKVEERRVGESSHDMFCPGTSYDESGKVIVTGGSTPSALSVYDPRQDLYYNPKDFSKHSTTLKVPRGYHGQTYLPTGKTFMIGGTWSGGDKTADKDGELYDPASNSTRILSNITASCIKMDTSVSCDPSRTGEPCVKEEWRQHHAWLFAWRKNSIFHAGPSKKMHWFFTEPTADNVVSADGLVRVGGSRRDDSKNVSHGDAVCGITSMYDAENGIILAAGGAPNYHYWHDANNMRPDAGHRQPATNLSFEIQLGEPGNITYPKQVESMKFQRIFANAVILPNGETFVVGGQVQGEPFHEETWQAIPEIYSPDTKTWRNVARHSTPRVYHSWAMLLPDASVIVGGGGLERDITDHYDAQIYQPAYLFKSDGKALANRPKINTVDKQQYKVGDKIIITTDVPVDAGSLIRYSATTHTVNNDLRRIKLTPTLVGNAADKTYTVQIPGDPGVTLPGYWMLFVLAKGVPSHAKTVQILVK